ncbi:hypothetical protein D0Z07_9209 [Hyphodiscus hymeniophilus]|uniref:Uncharacterized protein n=1 Tax=Hyphodiscus hymeniophilus TaxID=353542 RepID=A0A9P6SPF1_9HELO|nr:hypothetical protein D0Z07_9209 [Hyphodiscus hymeniophilus]
MESPNQDVLDVREQRVCRDKLAKYRGSAKVWISHLEFPHPSRQVDRRVIEQLKRDFDGEGCIKERANHRIPAVIDDSTLQVGLEKLSITAETFKVTSRDNPPNLRLKSGIKLECLHGQHRVLAAKEHLIPSLRWWIVDLYSTGQYLEIDTKVTLREGYSYSAKYTSGEIFRYIRLCHYDNDSLGVQRWRGRLSDSQNQSLSQLLKREKLMKALDSVLHIQGLWRTFYVGSMDVFLNLKCDDEIAQCIKFIKSVLTHVIGDDISTLMETDPFTIESIQSRAPALSKSDFEYIQKHMRPGGLFFPAITDSVRRTDIAQRLLATEELIPSLYTLIKDIRYLKQPAAILDSLLPKCRKKTLRQRYNFHFTGVESREDTIELQQSVFSYLTISNTRLDSFDISYQQLWLCAYRICKYSNAYGQHQVANLAHRLGFSSTEINQELKKDPDQAVIEKAVIEAVSILRPNDKFAFNVNQAKQLIASFHNCMEEIVQAPVKSSPPSITVAGSGEPLARRCGSSSADTHDLENLFIDKVHAPLQEYQKGGDEISSFYVKRSRHRAFFGAVSLAEDREGSSSGLFPTEASVEQGTTTMARQAEVPAGLGGSSQSAGALDSNSIQNSEIRTVGQVVQYTGRMVRFKEHNVTTQEVPFEKEAVNEQARVYANQGKKLSVQNSGHFIWHDCFDILCKTRQSTVQVFTNVQPINGKRHYNQDLPDSLQPMTKESFEFEMEESDPEL